MSRHGILALGAPLLTLALGLGACRPGVPTDEPLAYTDPEILKRLQVGAIVRNADALEGRMIEASGLVTGVGENHLRWWNFQLTDAEDPDLTISCYEEQWHAQRRGLVHQLLRHAKAERRPIRIAGRMQPGLLVELDWVEYDGVKYDTDRRGAGILQ